MFGFKSNKNETKTARSSRSERRSRPKRPSRVEREELRIKLEKRQRIKKLVPLFVLPLVGLGVAFPYIEKISNQVLPDNVTLCYDSVPQEHVPVYIGYEATRLFANPAHLENLKNRVLDIYDLDTTAPNTRIAVFNSAIDSGVVARPVLVMCKPAATIQQQQVLLNANSNIAVKDAGILESDAKAARKKLERKLDEVIADSAGDPNVNESWDAPILRYLQSISRYYQDRDVTVDHMVIFSSGLNYSPSARWCKVQHEFPPYAKWKNTLVAKDLVPFESFRGMKTSFLLLEMLDKYPQGAFCEQREIKPWWQGYFKDHTGIKPDIITQNFREFSASVGSFGATDLTALLLGLMAVKSRSSG